LNCKLWREAEKMIAYGLSGNPTYEVAQELRDLYNRIPSIKPVNEPLIPKNAAHKPSTTLIVVGTFKMADAENNIIKILANTKDAIGHQKIEVPKGLNEIVKMYFDELVRVTIRKKTNKLYELLDIEKYKLNVDSI
jgi:hypothetical protein